MQNIEDSIEIFNKGNEQFKNENYEKALESYQQYASSVGENESEILADCFLQISLTYGYLKNDEQKLEFANKAILIYERLNIKKINYARCFSSAAEAYFYQARCEEAKKELHKYKTHLMSLNLFQNFEMANYFILLSKVNFKIDNYEDCIKYALEGAKIFKKLEDCLNSLACCYRYAGDASGYIRLNDDFKNYFKMALKIYDSLNDEKEKAFCLKKLSCAYGYLHKYDEALKCALKSYSIYEKLNIEEKYLLASSIKYVGIGYERKKNYHEALEWYKKAFTMFNETDEQYEIDDLKSRIEKVKAIPNRQNNRSNKIDENWRVQKNDPVDQLNIQGLQIKQDSEDTNS